MTTTLKSEKSRSFKFFGFQCSAKAVWICITPISFS